MYYSNNFLNYNTYITQEDAYLRQQNYNPSMGYVQHNYQPYKCMTQREVEFMSNARSLWEEHVAWTRMAIISLVFNLPDANVVLARLLRNADDMGNMLRPIYGDNVANMYTALIKEHLLIAADLVKAAIAGNTQAANEAERKWYENADKIAVFLNRVNPFLTVEQVREMFYQHLALTKQEAVHMINKEYESSIAIYDQIEKQAREMADMISGAILKQHPGLRG